MIELEDGEFQTELNTVKGVRVTIWAALGTFRS